VDVVFHEAAYQDYMPDYSKFIHTNVVSTALIYELIRERKYRVKKVIIASSQAVYSEGQYQCKEHGLFNPLCRSSEQVSRADWEIRCPICGTTAESVLHSEEFASPHSAYALSKYGQELVGLRLGELLGIPTVALRYSIVQGARQSFYNQYSGVCRIFTLRFLSGKPPIIYEDGLQRRDYTHIDDVIDANMLVMNNERADYDVFNVGSGCSTTVLEYAELLARKLDTTIKPEIPGEYRAILAIVYPASRNCKSLVGSRSALWKIYLMITSPGWSRLAASRITLQKQIG
jgi:dTDP-L-rhamnose 4-epimerase